MNRFGLVINVLIGRCRLVMRFLHVRCLRWVLRLKGISGVGRCSVGVPRTLLLVGGLLTRMPWNRLLEYGRLSFAC